jgi:hypothetical protein
MQAFSLIHVRTLAPLLIALAITACGGGGGGSKTSAPAMPSPGDGGDGAPTISGQPGSTVAVGEMYAFTPSAEDPNGDPLTFSVANAPSWTSFDASSGRLSGTPATEDIGTYEGITITVSDGSASATLGPFAITVTEMGTGTATVSWTPPTTNTDGSALTDLSGYQVRYGRTEFDLSRMVEIDNPSVNRYVIENLTSGTWYFAVSAVNSEGIAGPLSNVGSKTIS